MYKTLHLLRGELYLAKMIFARIGQIDLSEIRSGHGRTGCYGPVVVTIFPPLVNFNKTDSITITSTFITSSFITSSCSNGHSVAEWKFHKPQNTTRQFLAISQWHYLTVIVRCWNQGHTCINSFPFSVPFYFFLVDSFSLLQNLSLLYCDKKFDCKNMYVGECGEVQAIASFQHSWRATCLLWINGNAYPELIIASPTPPFSKQTESRSADKNKPTFFLQVITSHSYLLQTR